jgi:hypothetical protein
VSAAAARSHGLAVVLEVGRTRVFATAVEWPGWCRSGRGEEDALETLTAYAERYAAVPALAGIAFDPDTVTARISVVERVPGDATTDFGAPSRVSQFDRRPLTARQAGRLVDLLEASWRYLDKVAAQAPATLTKGPRGGGRDRDAIVEHVVGAEVSYARKVRDRQRAPAPDPHDVAAVARERAELVAALRRPSDGSVLMPPKGWPPRYAITRTAWHVLDHAWEIEDKTPVSGRSGAADATRRTAPPRRARPAEPA